MSWRTVVITSTSKLDYQAGYLVVRSKDIKRVHLSEIAVVMVESTAVSITSYLMNELVKRNIKIVFCDEKHNPCAEVLPLHGKQDDAERIREQIQISENRKSEAWTQIVRAKISNQKHLLVLKNKEGISLLEDYENQIEPGDITNREAVAARIYFESLFGKDFTREEVIPINAALNYCYMVLCSLVSREISASGYLTALGIHHTNHANSFNLSCDLMEPFRPLVDKFVFENISTQFETDEKHMVIRFLEQEVLIHDRKEYFINAVGIYVKSVLDFLVCESNEIKFPSIL